MNTKDSLGDGTRRGRLILPVPGGAVRFVAWLGVLGAFAFSVIALAMADQVEMQNGERYLGKVLSVNGDSVVLESESAGKLTLPRGKVGTITFSAAEKPSSGAAPAATKVAKAARSTNSPVLNLAALPKDLSKSNSLEFVQRELLSQASPEATKKFQEMLSGVMTGKLTVNDVRAEAKRVADQVRSLKADLGDEAGFAVDGYLAILDSFIQEKPSGSTNQLR